MAATDVTAEVTAWAVAEVEAQCFGEEYGVSVTWAPAAVQGPQGIVQVPQWLILITARNPLLGQPPIYHMVPLAPVRPTEEQVKAVVTDGLRQLRDLASKILADGNGKAAVPS